MGKPADAAKVGVKLLADDPLSNHPGGYASFLERSEAERALLRERIAEADKGVFISSEAMMAWLVRLESDRLAPPPRPDVFLLPRRP